MINNYFKVGKGLLGVISAHSETSHFENSGESEDIGLKESSGNVRDYSQSMLKEWHQSCIYFFTALCLSDVSVSS